MSIPAENNSHGPGSPNPPWERTNIQQVPYMDSMSPRPSVDNFNPRNRAGTPSSGYHPKLSPKLSGHSANNSSTPSPRGPVSESRTETWRAKSPHVPPPLEPSLPYKTSVYVPQAARNPSISQAIVNMAPPTPPESLSSNPSPPAHSTTPMALPGTMSSREKGISPTRKPTVRRNSRERRTQKQESKPKPEPFGKRFRAAISSAFKREPVDESQLERIKDRHWTEDDY